MYNVVVLGCIPCPVALTRDDSASPTCHISSYPVTYSFIYPKLLTRIVITNTAIAAQFR